MLIFSEMKTGFVLNEENMVSSILETLSTMVLNFVRNGDPNRISATKIPQEEDRINVIHDYRQRQEVTNHDLGAVV